MRDLHHRSPFSKVAIGVRDLGFVWLVNLETVIAFLQGQNRVGLIRSDNSPEPEISQKYGEHQ